MATKTITVRVDETTKREAEVILEDIGLSVTVLFNACLKAVVLEKRIPFSMVSREYELMQMIRDKLAESETVANDPIAKRYTHEEIFNPLRKQYGYEIQD